MKRSPILMLLVPSLLLASCGPGGGSVYTSRATAIPVETSQPPAPNPTQATAPLPTQPNPAPASGLSPTELKYRLLDQYPDFFFCDPDSYPVARADETQLAVQRFADLQANTEEFQAILAHNGMQGATSFTDEQKLQIYRDHKKLAAIVFDAAGDQYQFQLQTSAGQQGFAIKGLIDAAGKITVQEKTATRAMCPICLASWTMIDTPRGAVRVTDLTVGNVVWTMNPAGERVAAPVLLVGSVQVPVTHQMIHLKLKDGRELWASPGHPTADGRHVGDLWIGDMLDGAPVTLAERVAYGQGATYDLLPAGGTGRYWADGILLGSTLTGP